jgi:hypothetical protein
MAGSSKDDRGPNLKPESKSVDPLPPEARGAALAACRAHLDRRRRHRVAVYQSIPGVKSETFVGRAAIHKYWFDVTREQSKIDAVQGEPIVTGDRASIEIWVTFRDPEYNPKGNHMITLLETNVVTFVKGGLASKNVEYWNIIPGVHAPPAGWGT